MELKVVVPTSLSEITLEQYQRFARLEGDEEFLTHKMLEIFCGVPLNGLQNVRIKDVSHVSKHINGMLAEKPNLKPTFTLGEQEFGFVPELDNITYGEFVDLDTYLQDVQNLHKAMAVLYRPIVQKVKSRYLIEPYESAGKYADLMKEAPMSVALGALLFFYRLGNELLEATLTYLEKGENLTSTPDKDSLQSVGDGMRHSINSLREMLGDLPKYPNLNLTSASTSSPSKSRSKKRKATY
jgi:uncharacterized protein YlxP (DUF503 family)